MLQFFRTRELPGVERICATHYRRGDVVVTCAGRGLKVEGPDTAAMRKRLRAMFDLDADHGAIEAHLQLSPAFLPGAWCPFELAVRAVLGQQVSVAAARTLAARLVSSTAITPETLADAPLQGLGILPKRVQTLRLLAFAARCRQFSYQTEELRAIPGIGPWTSEYIGMRVRRDPDAFPAGDLILRRAAMPGTVLTEAALMRYAERWRPFRAYAAIALWSRP